MAGFKKGLRLLGLLAILSITLWQPQGAFADEYYDRGVKYFNNKNYQRATACFEESIKQAPWESSSFYYAGLCYQMQGNWQKAKEKYHVIVDKFPDTAAYRNAVLVLKHIDPGYLTRRSQSATLSSSQTGDSGSDNDLSQVIVQGPQKSRIAFQRQDEKISLSCQINNRTQQVVFDPGSPNTVLNKKNLLQLGITPKDNKALVTIKLGEMIVQNFPVSVAESAEHITLGQMLFSKFNYSIDNSANVIVLNKKDASGGGAAGGYTVPFRKEAGKNIVEVQLNGRTCKMAFEEGGSSCVVPRSRIRELGLDVREESNMNMYDPNINPSGALRGEPGFGEAKTQSSTEASLRLGPIAKSNVLVQIDDTATVGRIGSGLFPEWQYTIDDASGVIRFKH